MIHSAAVDCLDPSLYSTLAFSDSYNKNYNTYFVCGWDVVDLEYFRNKDYTASLF